MKWGYFLEMSLFISLKTISSPDLKRLLRVRLGLLEYIGLSQETIVMDSKLDRRTLADFLLIFQNINNRTLFIQILNI